MVKIKGDDVSLSLLKDSNNSEIVEVQNKMKSLWSLLLNLEKDEAEFYAKSFVKEINENNREKELTTIKKRLRKETDQDKKNDLKKKINRLKPSSYPKDLTPGDVVHIQYGIRTTPEINGEHYGVFLKAKGSMCLVAPITSKVQPDGINTMHLKKIGFPNENAAGSYINFGQVGFISYRRIENIIGVKSGKINIGEEIDNIWMKFQNIVGINVDLEDKVVEKTV